jgi:hypothetical protein
VLQTKLLGYSKLVKHIRIWGLLALVALIISLPLVVGDPTFTSIGVYVLLFTGAAVAWNLFSGFTGYISLGSVVPEVQHTRWYRPISTLAL